MMGCAYNYLSVSVLLVYLLLTEIAALLVCSQEAFFSSASKSIFTMDVFFMKLESSWDPH